MGDEARRAREGSWPLAALHPRVGERVVSKGGLFFSYWTFRMDAIVESPPDCSLTLPHANVRELRWASCWASRRGKHRASAVIDTGSGSVPPVRQDGGCDKAKRRGYALQSLGHENGYVVGSLRQIPGRCPLEACDWQRESTQAGSRTRSSAPNRPNPKSIDRSGVIQAAKSLFTPRGCPSVRPP